MPKVLSVNISKKKGTIKTPVPEIKVDFKGILNDAHYGMYNRNISILGKKNIETFEKKTKRKINYGEFAENITIEGIDLSKVNLLDCFAINDVELEISQIGKECHGAKCAIFKETGDCIMPKEGIFCRVLSEGTIKAGASVIFIPKTFHATVITLSDRASIGEYVDKSGPEIIGLLEKYFTVSGRRIKVEYHLIPDNSEKLLTLVKKSVLEKKDIIITTGGTGIAPKDITPDTIKPLLDKEIPGIMEMIRMKYGSKIPGALLSRSIAGTIGSSLIYTLPGSVKAVEEYMNEILQTLSHLINTLHGLDSH